MRRNGVATLLAICLVACAHAPSKKEREAAEIHYQLGAEALQAGRRSEAMRQFDQALQSNDRHAPSYLGRGLVYQLNGSAAEAEREYRHALEINPGMAEAHNALGQLLATTGRLSDAVKEFDLALDDVTYHEAYLARCNKGLALYRLGQRGEGVAQLRACVSLAPRYCQGHRELGRIELEEGRVADAVASFTRYAELCEKVPDAWYQLALARMRAGDPDKAREAFERCEAVAGEDPLGAECRQKVQALR